MLLYETQSSQLTRAGEAIAAYLLGLKADLYKTPIDLTTNPPLATFQAAIADYAGYAQGVVTWDTPSVSDDGTVEVIGTYDQFRPTDSVNPNGIWGVYFTAAIGGALVFFGQFDTAPLPMASALNQITITLRYRPADQSIVAYVS